MAADHVANEPDDRAIAIDDELVHRFERTRAENMAAIAVELARLDPGGPTMTAPLAGGRLVLFGPGMYVNRGIAMGLGMTVTGDDLQVLEDHSRRIGVPAEIDVCPWADASLVERTSSSGYRPAGFLSALVRPLTPADAMPTAGTIDIAEVDDEALTTWQEVGSAGFGYITEEARAINDLFSTAIHRVDNTTLYLARIDGRPVGAAALTVRDGIATLNAMTTVPEARKMGVQSALIRHRLAVARHSGADIVAGSAAPGSSSERNLFRHGFRVLYTQVCVRKDDD